jgi:uncharacterized membrane protein
MDDRRLENIIADLLRAGVLMSAAIVTAGGIFYLLAHHAVHVNYHHFVAGGDEIRTVRGVISSAAHLNSQGWIEAGLLLLILTPVMRVAMAVIGFSLEGDRLYAAVSLVVLAILISTLIHAG